MSRRGPIAAAILFASAFALPHVPRSAAAATPQGAVPDTAVLVVVNDRVVRAGDFVRDYFAAWPPDRPNTDSAGRAQFLETIVHREIMAEVAKRVNRPLGFEDRLKLREYSDRSLSNALFRRMVLDSVRDVEPEVAAAYERMKFDVRLRRIVFADRATAERVRRDLVAKKVTWKDAQKKHSVAKQNVGPEGDMGWFSRRELNSPMPAMFLALAPGQTSEVYDDVDGPTLVQASEQRPAPGPVNPVLRSRLKERLRQAQIDALAERLTARMREKIHLTWDTATVNLAARTFVNPHTLEQAGGTAKFVIEESLPEFAPEDTGRVLARYEGGPGRFTIGDLLHYYSHISPPMRRPLNTPEGVRAEAESNLLEPFRAEMAVQLGLDKDPLVVDFLDDRTEGIRVQHLFEDSIESRVSVEPKERRKYYQDNLANFFTYAHANFATFTTRSKASADSVAARLRAGETAQDVIRADSLAGRTRRGQIRTLRQDAGGFLWTKEEVPTLKPGTISVKGPDADGNWKVLQALQVVPGRQLSYEEVEQNADESVRNLKAEARLKEFLARHSRTMKVQVRPELLSGIAMVERDVE